VRTDQSDAGFIARRFDAEDFHVSRL